MHLKFLLTLLPFLFMADEGGGGGASDSNDDKDTGDEGKEADAGTDDRAELKEALAKERTTSREAAKALKAAEKRLAELEAKQRDADESKAKEEGNFKQLLEQREQELADFKAQLAERDLNDLKRTIAKEEGLPGDLALRLAGEDEDALRTDAKALAKHLKAQDAPETDAGERTPKGTKKPDKSEFSNPARWGIRPIQGR